MPPESLELDERNLVREEDYQPDPNNLVREDDYQPDPANLVRFEADTAEPATTLRTPSLSLKTPAPWDPIEQVKPPEPQPPSLLEQAVIKYAPDVDANSINPAQLIEFQGLSDRQDQLRRDYQTALEFNQDPAKVAFIEADFVNQSRANGFTVIQDKPLSEIAFTPLIQLSPELKRKFFRTINPLVLPGTAGQIQEGLEDAAGDLAETMTSPIGIATLGTGAIAAKAATMLPKYATAIQAAPKVVSGAFAADMLSHTDELAQQLGTSSVEGDARQITRDAATLALNSGMTVLAAGHAISKTKPPPGTPPLLPVIEQARMNGAPRTADTLELIARDQPPRIEDATLLEPPKVETPLAEAPPQGIRTEPVADYFFEFPESKTPAKTPTESIREKFTDDFIEGIKEPDLKQAASGLKSGEFELDDFAPAIRRKLRDFLTQEVNTDAVLDSLKVDTQGKLYGGIEGLSTLAWNGGLEAVRLALKAGKAIDAALDDAIIYIRDNHASEQFDAVDLKNQWRSALNPKFPAQSERKGTTALRFLADQPEFQQRFPREAETIRQGDYISQTEKGRETMADTFLDAYREPTGQLDLDRAWRDLHEPDMMRGSDPALRMVTMAKVANESQGRAFAAKNPIDRARYQDMTDAAIRDIQLLSSTAGQGLQATSQAMEQAFGVQIISELREAIKTRQEKTIDAVITPGDVQKINEAATKAQADAAGSLPEPEILKIVADNFPAINEIKPVKSRLIDAKTATQLDRALASIIGIFTERQWLKNIRKLEPRNDEIWAKERQKIGESVARALAPGQKEIPPPLRDYFNNLLREASQIAKERTGPESPKDFERFNRLTPEEKLREIYNNREKYSEALNRAQELIHEKFADDPVTLKYLDEAIGVMHNTPFSERTISQIFQRQVAASGLNLRKAALSKDPLTKFRADMAAKIADAIHPELHDEISSAFNKWLDIKLDQSRKRAGDARTKAEAADIDHMANYQEFISDRIMDSVRENAQPIKGNNKATADLERILSEVKAKVREQIKTESNTQRISPEEKIANNLRIESMAKEAFKLLKEKAAALVKEQPHLAKLLEPILKAKFDEGKATAPVSAAFNLSVKEAGIALREIMRDTAMNQKMTKAAIFVRILEHPAFAGLPRESITRIIGALEKTWNDHAAAILRREFERFAPLPNLKPKVKSAIKDSTLEIVRLANQGALNHEAFWNVLADKFNLPKFSEALARQIWEKSQAVQALPEGLARKQGYIDLANFIANQKGFSKTDLVIGSWYGGVLTRMSTQVGNFFGSLNVLLSEAPAMVVREPGSIGTVFSGLIRGISMNITGGEFGAIMKRGDFSNSRSIKSGDTSGMWEVLQHSPNPVARLFSNYRYTNRLMHAVDALFKDANLEAKASFDAYRKAKGADPHITKADLNSAISDMLQLSDLQKAEAFKQVYAEIAAGQLKAVDRNRRAIEIGRKLRPLEIMEAAEKFSVKATLNNEPGPTVLGAVYRALLPLRKEVPVLTPVLAFLRIPANVGDMLLDHSPVGLFRLFYNRPNLPQFRKGLPREAAYTLDEYQQLRAKILLSHLAVSGVGALATAFLNDDDPAFQLTGSSDNLGTRRKALLETGYQPYQIKIGKVKFSYKMSPAAMMLAGIGNLMDGLRYSDLEEKSLLAQFGTVLAGGGGVILDQSSLTGITQMMDRGQNMSSEKVAERLFIKMPANAVGAFMPGVLKEIDRLINPTAQQSKDWDDHFQQHNPLGRWSIGRPLLNVLGEPVERSGNPLSRVVSTYPSDPVWQAIALKANQGIFLPRVAAASKVTDDLGKRVKMTDEQFYEYAKHTGKWYRYIIENNLETFNALNDKAQFNDWFEPMAEIARARARQELGLR